MYSIQEESLGPYTQIVLKENNSGMYMSCIPAMGGQLNVLKLEKKGTLHSLLYSAETEAQCDELSLTYASGAHLFPFPNRLANCTYSLGEKTHQINTRRQTEYGHGLHGYLLDAPFRVISQSASEHSAQVELVYEQVKPIDGYPFLFTFSLTYVLSSDGLTIHTKVTNNGSEVLPFGLGSHPYICTGTPVDKLFLKKEATLLLEVDAELLPTGNQTSCTEFTVLSPIGHTTFDSCYTFTERSERATTVIHDPEKDLEIQFWQENHDNAYSFVQLYIPAHRKCIAIEPMTCPPNALNTKDSLIYLDPDSVYQVAFGISLK
jgi:aldose 1-epimerase